MKKTTKGVRIAWCTSRGTHARGASPLFLFEIFTKLARAHTNDIGYVYYDFIKHAYDVGRVSTL